MMRRAVRGEKSGKDCHDMGKRNRKKRALQRRLLAILSLCIAFLIFIFAIGPSWVDKRFNPTGNAVVQTISPSSQALHQSLTITDLHADSLLWGRNLAQSASHGHVDIPRLIQGNVALQNFTVVTQVPTPLKLEGNSERSDNIIKLAILQRWPVSTWFSLKARALHQAQQLESLDQQASDRFSMIKTATDVERYLAERQKDQKITAGLLGLEGAQAIEGKIENVDALYNAGFRVIGLAHFFDNEVSGSVHGIQKGGLTALGREVIQRVDDLHMIVDLAHASPQAIDDVLETTQRPVLVSHTGVQGTCDNV